MIASGTMIVMYDGTTLPIDVLRVGDRICTFTSAGARRSWGTVVDIEYAGQQQVYIMNDVYITGSQLLYDVTARRFHRYDHYFTTPCNKRFHYIGASLARALVWHDVYAYGFGYKAALEAHATPEVHAYLDVWTETVKTADISGHESDKGLGYIAGAIIGCGSVARRSILIPDNEPIRAALRAAHLSDAVLFAKGVVHIPPAYIPFLLYGQRRRDMFKCAPATFLTYDIPRPEHQVTMTKDVFKLTTSCRTFLAGTSLMHT